MTFRTNQAVIEAFFNQVKPKGKNPIQSLWFNGNKVYSYRSLLGIIDVPNKVLLIDDNIRHYSVTTSKHTSPLIREALGNNYRIFSIPLEEPNQFVLKFYLDKITELLGKDKRARKHKEFYKVRIKAYIKDSEDYAKYSGIKNYKADTTLMQELFKLCIL